VTAESALLRLVGEQRWFGAKSRPLAGGRVVDTGLLSENCVFALFAAEFADGGRDVYQLPYRVDEDSGRLDLSLADPALGRALLAGLRRSEPVATGQGHIEFTLSAPLPDDAALEPLRPVGAEQSNSSVVFGERAILKAYRRLESGESVELELLRFLAAHGFEHAPRLLGWYAYAGAPITATLGVLQEFVPGAREGWAFALASFDDPVPFLAQLQRLGGVTARMHAALASDGGDAAFRPEPLGAGELATAGAAAVAEARSVLDALPAGGAAGAVRDRADEICAHLGALHRIGDGGQAIRQHGDYHLGQVLWAGGDWLVLDFEGEPARPLAERRRKTTPLRDVAGMLRSFAYAAETMRVAGAADADGWERDARAAFLDGYHAGADRSLLPAESGDRARLLAAGELSKALYELRYELDNRPDWVHVPVAGILRLLDAAPA
jgi:maltokinase